MREREKERERERERERDRERESAMVNGRPMNGFDSDSISSSRDRR